MSENRRFETKVIHSGEVVPRHQGAVVTPIYQSAMFEYSGETSYHDVKYIRLNNTPNHTELHTKLASLEGGEGALVTASGMAAISTTLLTVLKPGDHLLAQNCLYGGTRALVTGDLADMGIEFDFIDAGDPASWESCLRPNTKAIYVESMTNPLLEVGDLEAVPRFAKAHGLTSLIDNTFPSPYNFKPLEVGYDISLHSATKYLNGHSDIVAGAVVSSAARIEHITHRLNHLGGTLDPHAAFLLNRGVKTLALRMVRHNASALQLAQALHGEPKVARVNYPGLPSHPAHERSKRLFKGFSGMISFELKGGLAAAERFIHATTLPVVAPSLGSVETLITRPAVTSHAGLDPEERRGLGISDGLIRVSVGIEACEDIVQDFAAALSCC